MLFSKGTQNLSTTTDVIHLEKFLSIELIDMVVCSNFPDINHRYNRSQYIYTDYRCQCATTLTPRILNHPSESFHYPRLMNYCFVQAQPAITLHRIIYIPPQPTSPPLFSIYFITKGSSATLSHVYIFVHPQALAYMSFMYPASHRTGLCSKTLFVSRYVFSAATASSSSSSSSSSLSS